MFVKKLSILMLLLLGFGEDFSNVLGNWLTEMVNFSFNFKVLCSRELCFCKCFFSIFLGPLRYCFQILICLIYQFYNLTRQDLHCFWLQILHLIKRSNNRSNKSSLLFVRSLACCTITFACYTVFLCLLTERYYVSEVSDGALKT